MHLYFNGKTIIHDRCMTRKNTGSPLYLWRVTCRCRHFAFFSSSPKFHGGDSLVHFWLFFMASLMS